MNIKATDYKPELCYSYDKVEAVGSRELELEKNTLLKIIVAQLTEEIRLLKSSN